MNNRYFYGLVTPVLFQGCFFKTNQLSYKFYLQLKTLTYTSSISINIFKKHISMFNVNATIKNVRVGVVFNTFLSWDSFKIDDVILFHLGHHVCNVNKLYLVYGLVFRRYAIMGF